VTVVGNGLEALAAHDRGKFDVVLMDLQMPELGGFDATAAIRARESRSGTRLRIVAMTAHAMRGDRERCLAAGMDGYIAKPIDARTLFGVVEEPAMTPPVTTSPAAAAGIFDRSSLLARLSGDEELLGVVVGLFLEDCPQRVTAIRAAVDAGDADRVRFEAHALRGAAANLSAASVAGVARSLEALGAERRLEDADAAWHQLSVEVDRLLGVLRRHNACEV
jgi:CheY-like chemotaxis protein